VLANVKGGVKTITYIGSIGYMCATLSDSATLFIEFLNYQAMAEDSRPSAWSKGRPLVVSISRVFRVGYPARSTNITQSHFSFVGLAGMYFSLGRLSLSDATMLTFLAPILTGFSGAIFLKEVISFRNMLSGCRRYIRHTCPSCY
jgi:drug/metabolite transporter (DMT)-like permease